MKKAINKAILYCFNIKIKAFNLPHPVKDFIIIINFLILNIKQVVIKVKERINENFNTTVQIETSSRYKGFGKWSSVFFIELIILKK